MAIVLEREARQKAIASLQRFHDTQLGHDLGGVEAAELLEFILKELGPSIHNAAVASLRARVADRLTESAGELLEDEFGFWPEFDRKRRAR